LTYYGEKLFYVNGGLNNYNVYIYGTVSGLGDYLTKINKIKNTRVLPIISDPSTPDSDGDGGTDYEEIIQYDTNPLQKNHFSYLKEYVVFNAHNSYDLNNEIMTANVQLVYAALADIAYEKGLRRDYYGNPYLDGYYLVSQPFGESNATKGKWAGLNGLTGGVNGYPSAEPLVNEWLTAAMKRADVYDRWIKDIDDPYFSMAICVIRMTQQMRKDTGFCSVMVWEDLFNRKAKNAMRWRLCAKSGTISDIDGQFRYYTDNKGTYLAPDGNIQTDNVILGF
jgi:hypothetical protein